MKHYYLSLALLILAIMISASANAATSGNYMYELNSDGTAVLTGFDSRGSDINIPWNLDGHMITAIGEGAFRDNQSIQSVTLPAGVRVIRESAFEGCTNLSEIKLPSMLETIEDRAFMGCKNLKSVFLPDSVSELGDDCFEAWTVLSGNPGSLAEAYSESVGQSYKAAVVLTPTPRPVSADYQYEIRNGGIYITNYIGTDYEVRVPAEIDGLPVRTIGLNAFSSRYEVETVILPEGLTALDKNAFRHCSGLLSIALPSTLKTIGDHAFYLCESLKEIVIPDGVTAIGERAFQGCKQLRSVTLPASIEKLTSYTFYDCHSKLTIYAPKNTAAHKFAAKKKYGYVDLDKSVEEPTKTQGKQAVSPAVTKGKLPGFNMSAKEIKKKFNSMISVIGKWKEANIPKNINKFPLMPSIEFLKGMSFSENREKGRITITPSQGMFYSDGIIEISENSIQGRLKSLDAENLMIFEDDSIDEQAAPYDSVKLVALYSADNGTYFSDYIADDYLLENRNEWASEEDKTIQYIIGGSVSTLYRYIVYQIDPQQYIIWSYMPYGIDYLDDSDSEPIDDEVWIDLLYIEKTSETLFGETFEYNKVYLSFGLSYNARTGKLIEIRY